MQVQSLDIGCGFLPFHKKSGEIGIDINRGKCDIIAEASHLPFKERTFDTIFMIHVLEHLDNPFLCLKEAIRVSKRHVTLYIDIPVTIHQSYEDLRMFIFEFPFSLASIFRRLKSHRYRGSEHKTNISPGQITKFLQRITHVFNCEVRSTDSRAVHSWFQGKKGNFLQKVVGFKLQGCLKTHKIKVVCRR